MGRTVGQSTTTLRVCLPVAWALSRNDQTTALPVAITPVSVCFHISSSSLSTFLLFFGFHVLVPSAAFHTILCFLLYHSRFRLFASLFVFSEYLSFLLWFPCFGPKRPFSHYLMFSSLSQVMFADTAVPPLQLLAPRQSLDTPH